MANYEKYTESEDEYEYDKDFEDKYDKMFGTAGDKEKSEYDRDVITGRRSKRPKMSLLNKGRVSKQEMDDLFLEY